MLTLAPELPGALAAVEHFAAAGCVVALGHSAAMTQQIDAAVERGMTHVTHLFNAMTQLHHRELGTAGCALTDDRLGCDLICDGVHVHPRMIALAARAKGEQLCLITDRVEPPSGADSDFGAGPVRSDGTALRLADGRLAGSELELDRAVANFRRFTGASLLEAVAAVSLRPARVLGVEHECGTLRVGARADFAVLTGEGEVLETWIGGRRVFERAAQGSQLS
jgi:N-acetylglucosamine-6-phosphate deacetylase